MGRFNRPSRRAAVRVGKPIRMVLTGSAAERPRPVETPLRTMTVGSRETVAAARLHADLVITPTDRRDRADRLEGA